MSFIIITLSPVTSAMSMAHDYSSNICRMNDNALVGSFYTLQIKETPIPNR